MAVNDFVDTRIGVGAFLVQVWEAAAESGAPSLDASVVTPIKRGVRIAAIDGVTPAEGTPVFCGLNGAELADSLLRGALGQRTPIEEALARVSEGLYDPSLGSGAKQCQATVIVADLEESGHVQLVRAGESVAFIKAGGLWSEVFPGDVLQTAARDAMSRFWGQNPNFDIAQRAEMEDQIVGDESAWHTTPVGRFPVPKLQKAGFSTWQELVIATDGARLDTDKLDDLETWLGELRQAEAGERGPKPHDDVTVIQVRNAV